MAIHDLGGGVRVTDLRVEPKFPGGVPSARLLVPDDLFPDAKGSLRYSAGPNPDARTVGQTAMGATATLTIPARNFAVGFKQVVNFRFHTAIYAGLKPSDGCIEESSTGLNFRFFLDCSINDQLQSPWAPFYLPRKIATQGRPITIEMPDQPAGKLRLKRQNSKRDRPNLLLAYRQSCRFTTYVVVETASGSHVPLEGFSWNYDQEIDVSWESKEPAIVRNTGSCRFDSRVNDLRRGDPAFDLFANSGLGTGDTIVTKFNRAMFAAGRGQVSPDYSIVEFDAHTENVTSDMLSRLPRG